MLTEEDKQESVSFSRELESLIKEETSAKTKLNYRLQQLVEDAAQETGDYHEAICWLGESLLQHADFIRGNRGNAGNTSWLQVFMELKRRSG